VKTLVLVLAAAAAVAVTAEYTGPLAGLTTTWSTAGDWTVRAGVWQPAADGLVGGPDDALCVLGAVPSLQSGKVSVTVTPQRRLRSDGWVVAALLLFEDNTRFWQLDLVEDPDGQTRRIELIERLGTVWQAQSQPGTRLEDSGSGTGTWSFGTSYRLELEWSAKGITGRVRPAGAAAWSWTRTYRFADGVDAVRCGQPALKADGQVARFNDLAVNGEPGPSVRLGGSTALLLDGPGPWQNAGWKANATALGELLKAAGLTTKPVKPEALPEALKDPVVSLVAAPDLVLLPRDSADALIAFVAAGGDLLATGGEPFASVVYRQDGQWVDLSTLLSAVEPRQTILVPALARGVQRSSNQMVPAPRITYGATGPDGTETALEVRIDKLTGWDTLAMPAFEQSPFGHDDVLTIVNVKGTRGQVITVEWKEDDGSRWIAAVPLSPGWSRHALLPQDFKFWPDGSPPERAETTFQPSRAKVLTFGPASGFGSVTGRPVEYSVGPFGVAPSPIDQPIYLPPVIETLSPWYKQYPAKRGKVDVRVPITRPRGLTAWPEVEGRYEAVGALAKPDATRYQTGAGAVITWLPTVELPDPAKQALPGLLKRDGLGLTLLNAGPERLVHRPGAAPDLAARVLNRGDQPADVVVTFEILKGKESAASQDVSLKLAPGATRGVAASAPALAAGEYLVRTSVLVGKELADQVTAPLRVVARADDPKRRVTVADGLFQVEGQRVFLHGTNYWPGYVSGSERSRYWGHWLTPRNYDPELVEADLATMQKLGVNLVSIQYSAPDQAAPLMDFLDRCAKHGIWANIYLSGAHPLAFNPEGVTALLEMAELRDNPTVFAYDLAWEPRLGDHRERRKLDAAWRDWIDEQYGDLATAEAAWGIAAPKDEAGQATNPTDEQITTDGEHRVMVAAYRRFADDLISRGYRKVVQHIHTLDPDALCGARTGYGGTGQKWPNRVMAYDLLSGAAWLDFTSPEGYGLPPSFGEGRRTGFITAYGRWAGHGAPVFWSEFGASIGPMGGTKETRQKQTNIWTTMLQVIKDSGADASAGWWWPGGWRVDERSDYGVTEPDGTPREALKVATGLAKEYAKAKPQPAGGEATIVIDRDASALGLHGLWEAHADEYVAAREKDCAVRLVTRGTGTTTATMPPERIGSSETAGPLKYANAEIAGLTVSWDGGQATVENGGTVSVPAGQACQLTIKLRNTGEAAWVPAGGTGGVSVVLDGVGTAPVGEPVGRYAETSCQVELGPVIARRALRGRVVIEGLGAVGEALSLTLAAQP